MRKRRLGWTSDFEEQCVPAEVTCLGCGWRVVFPHASFTALFAPPVRLRAAERRLTCRRCGRCGATVRAVFREYHG